MIYSGWIKSRC